MTSQMRYENLRPWIVDLWVILPFDAGIIIHSLLMLVNEYTGMEYRCPGSQRP